MPKYPTKLPKVFLACPFDKNKDKLVTHLNKLPWKVKVASDRITSDHLLKKIITEMKSCDFAIFDISGWNPNVCLELGLARGLNKQYYIINNTSSKKKDAPSDIKGLDRIDYDWDRRKNTLSLYDKLKDGIFKKKFITRALWKKLQDVPNAEKKFELVLNILHGFKADRVSLTNGNLKVLAKGLNLKKQEDFDEVVSCLVKLKVFTKVQRSDAIKPQSKLFK
jgi:hypothetical protein